MNLRLIVGCALMLFVLSAGTIIAFGLSQPSKAGLSKDLQQVKRDTIAPSTDVFSAVADLAQNQTIQQPAPATQPEAQNATPPSQQPVVDNTAPPPDQVVSPPAYYYPRTRAS